jgi:hypothetical protein
MRAEFAGDGGEFGSNAIGFEDAALFAGVKEAERGMRIVAEHGATAIVGSAIGTSVWIGDAGCGSARRFDLGLSGHGVLLFGRPSADESDARVHLT